MATRKIILDGDATGLKAAASGATTALKAELEAQKKAMADAKAAVKALSKDATSAEKQAARDSVNATKTALDAKRKAYAEASAAAKAASRASRDAMKEEAQANRELLTEMRKRADFMAGGKKGAAGGPAGGRDGGGSEGQIGRGAKQLGASLFAAVAMMNRAMQALSELENKLLDKTLSANETAGKRSEALRLAGVDMNEADALGKTIGATAGRLSSADISSALEMAAMEGSGKLKGQQVLDVLRVSGSGSAGSALTAASYGLSTKDSVALAERFRLQTRGGSLSREQGRAISGLMSGGQLKGAEGVADYLAAAQESGQGLKGVDGRAPFMGTDPSFYESYAQLSGRRSTMQAGVSVLESERNNAQGMTEAALASQDQAMSIEAQARRVDRERADLITAQGGAGGARAASMALSTLGLDDAAARAGLMPNQGQTFKVEAVVKQPAER